MISPKCIFAESNSFDPYFNLSFEKYLFDNVQEGEIVFYLWQNEKTVVIGRHQNAYKECNVTSLYGLGGKIARRYSGGGAVFHDKGNLNFSIITKDELFDVKKQLNVLIMALDQFGVHAEFTGRNDVTVLGKKFSGNAFRKSNGTSCHHGTIMINVDDVILQSALNVSREKLDSKGVDSVSSRVINLHDLLEDITVDSMKVALKDAFLHEYGADSFKETILVGGKDVITGTGTSSWSAAGSMLTMLKGLAEERQHLKSTDWIFGKNKEFTNVIEKRFDWGEVSMNFVVEGDQIKDVEIYSDCLFPNFIERIEQELKGHLYIYSDIANTIDFGATKFDGIDLTKYATELKELIAQNI